MQFDPVGQADFDSSCDIARNTLIALGISYRTNSHNQRSKFAVGYTIVPVIAFAMMAANGSIYFGGGTRW